MNIWLLFKTVGWTKKTIHAILTYKDSFSNYLRYFLDNIDAESEEKIDFLTNKNVKYLFYKFNDYLLFNGLNTVPIRHSKIAENEIITKEVQNRDWQYLLEPCTACRKRQKKFEAAT